MQIGTIPLLGVMFIGLKLAGFIDWSWWLVLLPFIINLVIALVIVGFSSSFDH